MSNLQILYDQNNANNELAKIMENLLVTGDLAKLTPQQRVLYYYKVCESVKLNPLTRPFDYIDLNGKLQFYARKDTAEQLRLIHNISIIIKEVKRLDDIYIVTASAKKPNGRVDESTGAVSLVKEDGEWQKTNNGKNFFKKNGKFIALSGDELANAYMKAETKAKRRVTLSICALGGFVDESEIESISSAKHTISIEDDLSINNIKPISIHEPPPPSTYRFVELDATFTKDMTVDETLTYFENKIESLNNDADLENYEKFKKENAKLINRYFRNNPNEAKDLGHTLNSRKDYIKRTMKAMEEEEAFEYRRRMDDDNREVNNE